MKIIDLASFLIDNVIDQFFSCPHKVAGMFYFFQGKQNSLRIARSNGQGDKFLQKGIKVDFRAVYADLSLKCGVDIADVLNQG